MKAMKLVIETTVGVSSKTDAHENPTIDDVLDAIGLMNGNDKSLITLEDSVSVVMIGGGPKNFICTGNCGHLVVNAISDSKTEDLVSIVVGGQDCEYSSKYILTKIQIEKIARALIKGNFLQAMVDIKIETC
jgi:hypothetical protein